MVGERLDEVRFLLHDRDAKFSRPFDEIVRSEGVRLIKTPVRAPQANAVAERPHRSLALAAPAGAAEVRGSPHCPSVGRRDVVGRLIHEYYAAAA